MKRGTYAEKDESGLAVDLALTDIPHVYVLDLLAQALKQSF